MSHDRFSFNSQSQSEKPEEGTNNALQIQAQGVINVNQQPVKFGFFEKRSLTKKMRKVELACHEQVSEQLCVSRKDLALQTISAFADQASIWQPAMQKL